MEVFEIREEIESASQEELEKIENENRGKTNNCLNEILNSFKNSIFIIIIRKL